VFAIPAALLDGRVLLNPRTAPYPGLDYDQYVKLISNREPAHEAAEIIVARAGRTFPASTPPVDRWVADVGGFSWAVPLVLNGTHLPRTPRFSYMDQTSVPRQVNAARFLIVEGDAPPWLKIGNARVIRRWSRGGGGPPVVLYERPA
jgi:hypothetical protein